MKKITMTMCCLLVLISCINKEGNEIVYAESNQQVLMNFLVNDLLENKILEKMYPAEYVLQKLGKYKQEKTSAVDMSYEGAKINKLEKYHFSKFNAFVYVLENDNKIFGYLELLPEVQYSKFSIGTDMKKYIDLNDKGIKQSNDEYYFFSSFQDNWDLQMRFTLNKDEKIENVRLYLGGI